LPSHDERGNRTSNPPLALDLHYLLTAYGTEDLQAEVLLGYAMQLLHEMPVLPREAIRNALNPSPVNGSILPAVFQALRATDLAEQMEQIKITPASLNTEEMSRLWSALQAHYRPTTAYQASVVLIESNRPARSPLPVLSRGKVDPVTNIEKGITVLPGLIPTIPMIETVETAGKQVVAQLDKTITINGHHLGGTSRSVVLINERFKVNQDIPIPDDENNAKIEFKLPNSPTLFPVGFYQLAVKLISPTKTDPRTTNQISLMVAPEITTPLPINNLAINADGSATIKLVCRPEVRREQKVSLLFGDQEIKASAFATPLTNKLTFEVVKPIVDSILSLPPLKRPQLIRLRVDNIESPIIDRSPMPEKSPVFFDHRITLT